jgi:nitroreductase
MSVTPNALSEMGNLKNVVISKEERPNPSFKASALPGFKKAVQGRRAIRIFDGIPLPEDEMRDCLRDATLAPSSSNLQCYELYWIRDEEVKKKMVPLCLGQPAAKTAGDIVVVVSRVDDWQSHHKKLTDILTDHGKKPMKGAVLAYYENVVPMLMKTDRWGLNNLKRRLMFWYRRRSEPTPNGPVKRADHRVYGHIQASLAAQTLMLSIAAHGYESCPMGGIDKRAIAELLGLPTPAVVSFLIGVGRGMPEGLFSARTRLPFGDLVKEV